MIKLKLTKIGDKNGMDVQGIEPWTLYKSGLKGPCKAYALPLR